MLEKERETDFLNIKYAEIFDDENKIRNDIDNNNNNNNNKNNTINYNNNNNILAKVKGGTSSVGETIWPC